MTIAGSIARSALAAAAQPDEGVLRARLVANLVAALGNQDDGARVGAIERPVRAPGIAYCLAAHMHARTQDDFYPPGRVHVGAVCIPAALAVGPVDPLPAIAAGYEALAVVSEAYAPEAQRRGFRPTGVFGPIGAAVAAAVGLGLSAERIVSAITLATASCGGTNQAWLDGSDEWLIQVAAAARSGVEAALLADSGLCGAPNAIEGRAGWARAYFGDLGAGSLKRLLDTDIQRAQRVALKRYPISGIAQVPTALAAEAGVSLAGELARRIEVRMSPDELDYPGSRNRGPFASRSDALMSVVRCVSLGYVHGTIPYRSLGATPSRDEMAVSDLVELVADETLAETEAVFVVDVGGEVRRWHGHGEALLYPQWEDIENDLEGLAARAEAPVDRVKRITELVRSHATADDLVAAMSR